MSHLGKSHLVIMFTVGPDAVAEGDRIVASVEIRAHPVSSKASKAGARQASTECPSGASIIGTNIVSQPLHRTQEKKEPSLGAARWALTHVTPSPRSGCSAPTSTTSRRGTMSLMAWSKPGDGPVPELQAFVP